MGEDVPYPPTPITSFVLTYYISDKQFKMSHSISPSPSGLALLLRSTNEDQSSATEGSMPGPKEPGGKAQPQSPTAPLLSRLKVPHPCPDSELPSLINPSVTHVC